jgi:predicted branched-subunit amino acid permease
VDSLTISERRGVVRDGVGLGAAVGLYGVAFGATATAAGLSVWQASVLSLLMFTGASQFALVGIYGLRLADVLSYRGWRRVAAAHWVIDETTAITARETRPELARLAFVSSGSTLFLFWNLSTVAGALGAQSFGPVLQAALGSVVPAAFLALLWPRLVRGADLLREQRIVALGGAVIALALTPVFAPGLQIIAAALAVLLAIRTGSHEAEAEAGPQVKDPRGDSGGSA